jgi:hypothetical protein
MSLALTPASPVLLFNANLEGFAGLFVMQGAFALKDIPAAT